MAAKLELTQISDEDGYKSMSKSLFFQEMS